MHVPEVQEMLRRLSECQLGIFMPHTHDAESGDFQPLPDDIVQVESGLQVSFRSSQEIASQTGCVLPVGWVWRAGAPTLVAACEMDEPPFLHRKWGMPRIEGEVRSRQRTLSAEMTQEVQ